MAPLDDVRSIGSTLKGQYGEFWRYRVGDYRVIAKIEDEVMRVYVVKIGNAELVLLGIIRR